MITKMKKIQMIVMKNEGNRLISLLHKLGLLHIELTRLSENLKNRGYRPIVLDEEDMEFLIIGPDIIQQTNRILQSVNDYIPEVVAKRQLAIDTISYEDLEESINAIEDNIQEIFQEKKQLETEAAFLEIYKKIMDAFKEDSKDFSRHADVNAIALSFDKKFKDELTVFKRHIEAKIKSTIDIYFAEMDRNNDIALIFYKKEDAPLFEEELVSLHMRQFKLGDEIKFPFSRDEFALLDEKKKKIESGIDSCRKRLHTITAEHVHFLKEVKLLYINRMDKIMGMKHFVESKHTVTIEGWLPKKKYKETVKSLKKEFDNKIVINDLTKYVTDRNEIPVLLDNSILVKPFELLTSILQPPKYGSIDPTRLVAIFFPVFFGLIVGDIGYGLVILIISLLLKRKKKPIFRTIASIAGYASITTILFGILFGEFFGDLGMQLFGMHPILFNRGEDAVSFLIFSISIGVFHVLLGIGLSIVNSIKFKHTNELFEKSAIFISIFGLLFLVASLTNYLPRGFLVPSIILLIIAVPIIIKSKGLLGPLEIISAVANILSYARIMALGIAGVMLAHIANKFGGLIENIIVGIMVASLIHILNIAICIFSPTIQSLRLHYVEFFGKFFEPGGKKYRPFKTQKEVK